MATLAKVKGFGTLFWTRWKGASSTIAFYLVQFLLVMWFFGTNYAMVVSGSTTLFQLRRREPNRLEDYLSMFFMSLVLCLLAFAAGLNVWLCALLNFGVLFILVIWKCSQFAPKGHLGYAMTFVFLELRPISPEQLPAQLTAVAFCSLLLVVALIINARAANISSDPAGQIARSLNRLATLLDKLGKGEADPSAAQELYELARSFHRQGYGQQGLLYLPDNQKRFYHLFALLFQRASYLVADDAAWQEARATPGFAQHMNTLAEVVRQLQNAWEPAGRQRLAVRLQALLDHTDLPQGRLRIFYRSVLHTLLLLCRESFHAQHSPLFRKVPWRAVGRGLRQRLSPTRFEFRFALRLGVVMVISATVSYLWEFEHTYWFPLHAFLLLQPSYEESAHRMVTRPIGTAIGCLLVHLAYPWLPGLPGVFLFSLVMISLMYCCTPGTWVQPIFSTSFALTMATLTIQTYEAIWLRLFYLAMAVALVLVVNTYLLPSRKEPQFRRNLQELFRLQAEYWTVIRRSLAQPVDPGLFSELLAQFHMVYHEAAQFAVQLPEDQREFHHRRLVTLWNMFSELEQTEGLVQTGALSAEEREALESLAARLEARIRPLGDMDGLTAECLPDGELRYLVGRYLKNAQTLLAA